MVLHRRRGASLRNLSDWLWLLPWLSCLLSLLLHNLGLLRNWSGRRTLFTSSQKLLDILVILLAEHSSTLFALEQQVVGRGYVVESVSLDFLLSLCSLNVVILYERANDFGVNRNWLVPQVDWWRVRRLVIVDRIPWVVPDVLNRVALCRIWIQNVLYQVLSVFRQKARHLVVRLDDLLVEFLRVLVFEWQVATDHRV